MVLRGLPEPDRPTSVQVTRPFTHTREGLQALAALPLLKALAVGQFLAALSAGATSTLLVVLAHDRLGDGEGFGLLIAAIGAGAALGPLLLVRRIKDSRRPLFVFGPYAVRGLVDLALTVVTTVPLAIGALLFYGLSTSTGNVTFASLIQSGAIPSRPVLRHPVRTRPHGAADPPHRRDGRLRQQSTHHLADQQHRRTHHRPERVPDLQHGHRLTSARAAGSEAQA